MTNYIRRINYRRKKLGLPKAKYIYVTEHDPDAKIRWHHHVIMDGLLDRDVCEKLWKLGERSQSKRLEEDAYGLVGMAKYITKDKHRQKMRSGGTALQDLDSSEFVRSVLREKAEMGGMFL